MTPPAGTPFLTGTSSRIKARRQAHFSSLRQHSIIARHPVKAGVRASCPPAPQQSTSAPDSAARRIWQNAEDCSPALCHSACVSPAAPACWHRPGWLAGRRRQLVGGLRRQLLLRHRRPSLRSRIPAPAQDETRHDYPKGEKSNKSGAGGNGNHFQSISPKVSLRRPPVLRPPVFPMNPTLPAACYAIFAPM